MTSREREKFDAKHFDSLLAPNRIFICFNIPTSIYSFCSSSSLYVSSDSPRLEGTKIEILSSSVSISSFELHPKLINENIIIIAGRISEIIHISVSYEGTIKSFPVTKSIDIGITAISLTISSTIMKM